MAAKDGPDGAGAELAGLAALSILEALLVELEESGVMNNDQIQALLEDAIDKHLQAADGATGHDTVALLIRRLLTRSDVTNLR